MKKTLISIFISIYALVVIGQNDTSAFSHSNKTLFNAPAHVGWYIAPEFAWTKYDSRNAVLAGLNISAIFDHKVTFGFAGYGIINSYNLDYADVLDSTLAYLYGGYGGIYLEYRVHPESVVHFSFSLLIGGGALTMGEQRNYNNNYYNQNYYVDEYDYIMDGFFIIEPGVLIGINILDWMRLDVGAKYRFAPSIDLPQSNADAFTGINLFTSLKFGSF